MILEVLIGSNIALSFLAIVVSLWCYRKNYLLLADTASAFKMLVDLINKNFTKDFSDHEEMIKTITTNDEKVIDSLSENDQKIMNAITESQKNLVSLAYYLGYRPRNLEDL